MKHSKAGATNIHPTAVAHPKAELGRDVTIGPYAVIGPRVVIGDHCEVKNHATIEGPTVIGRNNRIFPYASIGQDSQDKKFSGGEPSALEIGDDNTFREFVTLNRGSPEGGGTTRIGSNNWVMAYCHIAHDCLVGNETIFANGATLGGHVTIKDGAYLGGYTAIHQFCSVGELTMTGGQTMIAQDLPPYVIAAGNRARLYGVNRIGLQRHGFAPEEIEAIQEAYKLFFRGKLSARQSLATIEAELGQSPHVMNFVTFIRDSTRGICR
ncbi:MAG: acyl-ACP--UDP-N-acetylglucosamine O-acyltransferase [SAR324 cluster bacterium]|nr:acyl-ACP--UDP-N-acetylglucosamine O-acyltransferase [SAR324 cluster bacterium]